ncbi:hypothetical protein [Natrinema soli]|uniref:Uncharacterized protein n=1 Tax=Natrinema soli TaxID=1930624 RepID=A0ABD5SMX4_9EURY|nr:hypothetical protein [Natrinema soli]
MSTQLLECERQSAGVAGKFVPQFVAKDHNDDSVVGRIRRVRVRDGPAGDAPLVGDGSGDFDDDRTVARVVVAVDDDVTEPHRVALRITFTHPILNQDTSMA